jgi:hypothetical protein
LSGKVTGQSNKGTGMVSPLGAVTSTVSLKEVGAEPVVYSGTVTLVGASGTITATLSGRVFGPSYLNQPIHLTYTITGGTGAFAGAKGSGQATYLASALSTTSSFTLTFGNTTLPPSNVA